MAAAIFRRPIAGDYSGKKKMERKLSGKRRVFVQTDSGFVYGLELDRIDNAHTVKRKLQVALNVPTEQSSLLYGDMVLKNDLSAVRNHSPLLLARNLMHRSSSTPCLSPTSKDLQQRDQSGVIEILGSSLRFDKTKELVEDIVQAMKSGIDPVPVCSGLGGAYYFRNCHGENVAIVKPTDEEPYAPNNPKGFVGKALGQPGLKRSVRVGETGFREAAAYLLDYGHFANVPSTALVKVTHSIFNINDGVKGKKHQTRKQVSKIASLQEFIPHDFDASDHGTSSFPVAAVHRIGLLDIRIFNTDRHAGNLLVKKLDGIGRFGQVDLIPIDHGLCLPETLEDPYFEWIHWPQASIPFSEEELEYIDNLDPVEDSEMLRMELPMIREACLRVLVLCTTFLKEAAAFGLCLAEIGEMMSREFRGHDERPSELELVCIEGRRLLEERVMVYREVKAENEQDDQFDLDTEEFHLYKASYIDKHLFSEDSDLRSVGGSCRNPFSKQRERLKGYKEEAAEGDQRETAFKTDEILSNGYSSISAVSKLTSSLKNMSVGEESWRHPGAVQETGFLVGASSGNRSVNEQLPASSSFVKFNDLNEEEWMQFLEIFQKQLQLAFANRKAGAIVQRQRQRLGTSCLF